MAERDSIGASSGEATPLAPEEIFNLADPLEYGILEEIRDKVIERRLENAGLIASYAQLCMVGDSDPEAYHVWYDQMAKHLIFKRSSTKGYLEPVPESGDTPASTRLRNLAIDHAVDTVRRYHGSGVPFAEIVTGANLLTRRLEATQDQRSDELDAAIDRAITERAAPSLGLEQV